MSIERGRGYTPQQTERWKYDSRYPHRFEEKLVLNGYDIVARTPDKITIALPAGQHELSVGFPELDLDSTTYHYGNNPVELQARPLILDYNHPAVKDLSRRFDHALNGRKPFIESMVALDATIQNAIKSNTATERIERMSEIIENGQSVCAGKVLIAETLLKQKFGDKLSIQEIGGTSSRVHQKRPHDISHVWLRVAYGNQVSLYDPYYQHLAFYDVKNGEIETSDEDPFTQYEVFAGFLAVVHNAVPLKSFRGVRVVDTIQEGYKEFFVEREFALQSQINNSILTKFVNQQPGKLDLFEGGIKCTHDENDDKSAGFVYPLQKLKLTA